MTGFTEVTRGCYGTRLDEVGKQCHQAAVYLALANRFIYWNFGIIANVVRERDIPSLLS